MGGWVLVGLVFIAYAVVAGRLDRLSISAPIVLVAAGIVLGAGFLDVLPANPTTETVRLITELTLALILFADASTIKFRQARSDIGFPSRLPGIGLPLTILLGTPADGQHLRRLLDRHEERSVRQVDLRVVIRSRAGGPVVVAHSAIDGTPHSRDNSLNYSRGLTFTVIVRLAGDVVRAPDAGAPRGRAGVTGWDPGTQG